MKLSPSKLQASLDALAAANNRAMVARNRIMEHCAAVYGVSPGDVDNDQFIDSCDGGAGFSPSMSARDFDRTMREGMELAGIPMPGAEEDGA